MDYGPGDRARRIPEAAKRGDRSEFARDRARVLHSSALRRLAAKTQVVVPWEDDFPRTRLTHSLECAQIGRELGAALGCDPDLVDTACLAHDLGHPPFGHNGEMALNEKAQACGGFEGNAQSLRILVRLEAKAVAADGTSGGLNLTRAALDASCKYPWPRRPGSPKFGVYADDSDAFHWIRHGAPDAVRCFEAQIMDWADDVAYSVHDFEDAVHAGHLQLAALHDPGHQRTLAEVAKERYAPDAGIDELRHALVTLQSLAGWPKQFDGRQRSLVALKDATSQLIGRLCASAELATRAAYESASLVRYRANLVVPQEARNECAMLKAVTAAFVMDRQEAVLHYAHQREVVAELCDSVMRQSPDVLQPAFREQYEDASDDAARLRTVVDQIASLTDTTALHWHARLCGNS